MQFFVRIFFDGVLVLDYKNATDLLMNLEYVTSLAFCFLVGDNIERQSLKLIKTISSERKLTSISIDTFLNSQTFKITLFETFIMDARNLFLFYSLTFSYAIVLLQFDFGV